MSRTSFQCERPRFVGSLVEHQIKLELMRAMHCFPITAVLEI